MKYSVCIDMMFPETDFYDRFRLAKDSNVKRIEFWRWSNKDISKIESLIKTYKQKISVFNIDSNDEKLSVALSRGILNMGRKTDFISALIESIPVYRRLQASGMIVLIGENLDIPYTEQVDNVLSCLKAAVPIIERENITLLLEPLNNIDRENYFLPRAKEVIEIIREINSPNVKILLDLYHEQIMAGNLVFTIKENIDVIGHIHIADVPGRHEPGTGEINYCNILRTLKELNYKNCVGFEFRSTKNDKETMKILRRIMV